MARRRQHRQTEGQARNDFEIPDFEQIDSHGCPQKPTDVTAIRQAVRRLGINHDRIEMSADTSRWLDNYAPRILDWRLHLRFAVPRWNLPGERSEHRANGSRGCAPDDKLRDNHQFGEDGFRRLNPSCELAAQRKNGLLRRFRFRSLSDGGQVAPRNDGLAL